MPPSRPLPRAVPPPRVARTSPLTVRKGTKAPVLAVEAKTSIK